jgi:hypothetical protein
MTEVQTPFQAAIERLQQVKQMMADGTLIQGEDYGLIQGFNKPSLFKPGAQKLMAAFSLASVVRDVIRDATVEELPNGSKREIVSYRVIVTLQNKLSGMTEAEGVGSCNSAERKYARQSPADVDNTLLKMAKKRGLIDATLDATGACSVFTQDVEDMHLEPQPMHHNGNGNSNGNYAPQPSAPAPSTPAPPCPACGGDMYDNRVGKKNEKAPDFKCKNKMCVDERGFTTAVWQQSEPSAPYTPPDIEPPQPPSEMALEQYAIARLEAMAIGFKTPSGNDPAEAETLKTEADAIKRTRALQAWVESQKVAA